MESVTHELTLKLGESPSQLEIAQAMGVDQQRWQTLMIDFRSFGLASFRERSAESDDLPSKEIPASPQENPDRLLARLEMKQALARAMQTLPQRYRQVVKLYYEAEMSMKEIGEILGVNESRISQIHKSALSKMQVTLGKSGVHSSAFMC